MKKLAVIGSGIAGMSAAYFLKDDYEITVFEKNNYVGGHTNTISINEDGKEVPFDTGFMVFNEKTYPYLVKLFKKLGVEYVDTDMSFSVYNKNINLEYNGSNLDGLYAQRKNLLNLKFHQMLFDIIKFNNRSADLLAKNEIGNITIDEFVKEHRLGRYFFDNFLVPMSSAVWSSDIKEIRKFPAISLIRFFQNHGFVGINTQLQWKTVKGGSREYRKKIIEDFEKKTFCHEEVKKVKENDNSVLVQTKKGEHLFDKVIIAAHGDEALGMLDSPSEMKVNILSKFKYQKNMATVHYDESVMPKLKKNWSSWNFINDGDSHYTIYYMNRLQHLKIDKSILININGEEFVDEKKIIQQIEYHHPLFDLDALAAQARIDELNQKSNIHFCGSYYRYGFHEDALLSSVNLCNSLLNKEVL